MLITGLNICDFFLEWLLNICIEIIKWYGCETRIFPVFYNGRNIGIEFRIIPDIGKWARTRILRLLILNVLAFYYYRDSFENWYMYLYIYFDVFVESLNLNTDVMGMRLRYSMIYIKKFTEKDIVNRVIFNPWSS